MPNRVVDTLDDAIDTGVEAVFGAGTTREDTRANGTPDQEQALDVDSRNVREAQDLRREVAEQHDLSPRDVRVEERGDRLVAEPRQEVVERNLRRDAADEMGLSPRDVRVEEQNGELRAQPREEAVRDQLREQTAREAGVDPDDVDVERLEHDPETVQHAANFAGLLAGSLGAEGVGRRIREGGERATRELGDEERVEYRAEVEPEVDEGRVWHTDTGDRLVDALEGPREAWDETVGEHAGTAARNVQRNLPPGLGEATHLAGVMSSPMQERLPGDSHGEVGETAVRGAGEMLNPAGIAESTVRGVEITSAHGARVPFTGVRVGREDPEEVREELADDVTTAARATGESFQEDPVGTAAYGAGAAGGIAALGLGTAGATRAASRFRRGRRDSPGVDPSDLGMSEGEFRITRARDDVSDLDISGGRAPEARGGRGGRPDTDPGRFTVDDAVGSDVPGTQTGGAGGAQAGGRGGRVFEADAGPRGGVGGAGGGRGGQQLLQRGRQVEPETPSGTGTQTRPRTNGAAQAQEQLAFQRSQMRPPETGVVGRRANEVVPEAGPRPVPFDVTTSATDDVTATVQEMLVPPEMGRTVEPQATAQEVQQERPTIAEEVDRRLTERQEMMAQTERQRAEAVSRQEPAERAAVTPDTGVRTGTVPAVATDIDMRPMSGTQTGQMTGTMQGTQLRTGQMTTPNVPPWQLAQGRTPRLPGPITPMGGGGAGGREPPAPPAWERGHEWRNPIPTPQELFGGAPAAPRDDERQDETRRDSTGTFLNLIGF